MQYDSEAAQGWQPVPTYRDCLCQGPPSQAPHPWQFPNAAGQKYSTNPTGYTPTTSSLAHSMGASWAGGHQAINKLGDLKQPTQPQSTGVMTKRPRCLAGATGWQRRCDPYFSAMETSFLLLCCVTLGKSLPLSELHLALMHRGS